MIEVDKISSLQYLASISVIKNYPFHHQNEMAWNICTKVPSYKKDLKDVYNGWNYSDFCQECGRGYHFAQVYVEHLDCYENWDRQMGYCFNCFKLGNCIHCGQLFTKRDWPFPYTVREDLKYECKNRNICELSMGINKDCDHFSFEEEDKSQKKITDFFKSRKGNFN